MTVEPRLGYLWDYRSEEGETVNAIYDWRVAKKDCVKKSHRDFIDIPPRDRYWSFLLLHFSSENIYVYQYTAHIVRGYFRGRMQNREGSWIACWMRNRLFNYDPCKFKYTQSRCGGARGSPKFGFRVNMKAAEPNLTDANSSGDNGWRRHLTFLMKCATGEVFWAVKACGRS